MEKRRIAIRQLLKLPMEQHGVSLSGSLVQSGVNSVRDVGDIPKEFDARKNWQECSSVIGAILNQETCGGCWAMSGAGVLGDRMCIAQQSKGVLSPQYLIYCGTQTNGCEGALTSVAWDQIINEGTVTDDCIPVTARDGACPTKCRDGSNITEDTRIRAKSVVSPWGKTADERVKAIQNEIMTNGPVIAGYFVYNDFRPFFEKNPGGVYRRNKCANFTGVGHLVRIIGWGTSDSGEDYWLVANSWGTKWGDNGFFRIHRGNNECNLEEQVGAGIVD